MKDLKWKIRNEIEETKVLLRCVPPWVLAFVVMSFIMMNLLANKSIGGLPEWLALDAGTLVSWVAFMSMDVLVKRFGPKAATKISVIGVLFNLLACSIFFIGSAVPGYWGESFAHRGQAADIVNQSLNNTFGGTWYVLFGSTVAVLVSTVVNNSLNYSIGKLFKKSPNSFTAYACRSYVSTTAGQFVDNLVFALIVSVNFFGWTLQQAVMCAVTGAIVECLFEVLFSPFGYRIVQGWDKQNIGKEYLDYIGE